MEGLLKNLNKLSETIHYNNGEAGFWDEPRETGTLLMLCVSELSEALEADRKGKHTEQLDLLWAKSTTDEKHLYQEHFTEKIKDTFEDEIADTFIRLFDLCGAFDIDIESHILLKLGYNKTRPYKHNKKY